MGEPAYQGADTNHCDKQSRTFSLGGNNYLIMVSSKHSNPCSGTPWTGCWICWARSCHVCLDLYKAGERWGPGSCANCTTDNGTPADSGAHGNPTWNAPTWNAAAATVDDNTEDEETPSIYNGNMDSPVSNQGDSAYSRSYAGSPYYGTGLDNYAQEIAPFMGDYDHEGLAPILSKIGLGGYGALEEIQTEDPSISALLQTEPMEIEEGPTRTSTPVIPRAEEQELGEKPKSDGKDHTVVCIDSDADEEGNGASTAEADTSKRHHKTQQVKEADNATPDHRRKQSASGSTPGDQMAGNQPYRIPRINAVGNRQIGDRQDKYTSWQLATYDKRQEARRAWLERKQAKEENKEETEERKREENIRRLKSEIAKLKEEQDRERSPRSASRSREREQYRSDSGRVNHGKRRSRRRDH